MRWMASVLDPNLLSKGKTELFSDSVMYNFHFGCKKESFIKYAKEMGVVLDSVVDHSVSGMSIMDYRRVEARWRTPGFDTLLRKLSIKLAAQAIGLDPPMYDYENWAAGARRGLAQFPAIRDHDRGAGASFRRECVRR